MQGWSWRFPPYRRVVGSTVAIATAGLASPHSSHGGATLMGYNGCTLVRENQCIHRVVVPLGCMYTVERVFVVVDVLAILFCASHHVCMCNSGDVSCRSCVTVNACLWNMNGYMLLLHLLTIDKDKPHSTKGPMPAPAGCPEVEASQAKATTVC